MSLRAATGTSDFVKLRKLNAYYVDKTAFVDQWLASLDEAVLLPRPRRFGKTLNMSTLRTFVERSPIDRSPLFHGLQVWDSEDARQHFQRYPVIFLSFKGVKCRSWPATFRAIRKLFSNEIKRHRALFDNPALEEDDAESLRLIMRQQGDQELYEGMLRDLSTLLTAHYGEPTVILIDEYDAPIQAAYARGFYNDAVDFFRTFLTEGFKDNPNLFKGAMTGVLRVAKEGVLSGLNNVEVYSVLGDKYATAFGFTDAEVEKLAGNMGTPEVADELRAWYDGYRIGGHAIYNPWSVMMYAKHRSQGFKAHWVLTSSDDVLRPLVLEKKFAITQDLEALIRGETVSKVISEHVVLRELDSDEDAVWSLLLMSGYLTARTQETVGGNIVAELAIPNRDVRGAFTTSVMSWIEAGLGGADEQVTELSRAMLEGNEQDFATLLSKLLTTTMSYHDPAGREPERVYQAFVLGMLVQLESGWHVRSNREAGHGRYDLAVIPKTPGKPGIVLELKSLDDLDDEKAEQALELALVQIRERRYTVELEAAGAEPILQYGVVFDGKRAWVRKG